MKIDRYSNVSEKGVSISFLDPANTFKGWKTTFSDAGSWLEYDRVDFGRGRSKRMILNARSANGGTLEFRANRVDGPLIATLSVPSGQAWGSVSAPVLAKQKGVQNLYVVAKDNGPIEVDWVQFQ